VFSVLLLQEEQTTQSPEEEEQTTQSSEEEEQTAQSPEEEEQTTQSPEEEEQTTQPIWYLQTLLVKLTNQTMEEIQSISQFRRKHNNDRNNI
jgi:hypothetical protein